MLENYYDKTITTKRLSGITDTKKEKYITYLTGVKCLIQPFIQSFDEDIDGSVGKDYNMFAEVRDIKEGDLIIDGSNEYKVVGVNVFVGSHIEVVIREYKK